MPDVDFALMKMVHSTWVLKLRAFLNGKPDVSPNDLISHRDCDLGKWIYATGLGKYGHVGDMQELERTHESMHRLVKRVVDLKSAGKNEKAEEEFLKVHELSKRVVALLTSLESKTD